MLTLAPLSASGECEASPGTRLYRKPGVLERSSWRLSLLRYSPSLRAHARSCRDRLPRCAPARVVAPWRS